MKKKSVLLIGLGRFGRHLAVKLNDLGHDVMAIDDDEERINDVIELVTNAQIGDSTNIHFLKKLGVENYDICIVTISGDFQSSLETTSLLKELGAKKVISRAERDIQTAAVVPGNQDAADVIDATHGAFRTDGWSLRIIHLHQFHPCSLGETLTKGLQRLFGNHSHTSTSLG